MKIKNLSKQQHRKLQQEWMIRMVLFIAGSFFLLVVFVMSLRLPDGGDNSNNDKSATATATTMTSQWRSILAMRRKNGSKAKTKTHRLAVLLPFVGQGPGDVPSYLNLFCRGARAASDVADFFLIHNGILSSVAAEKLSFCHTNVIFVNLQSTRGMAERLLRVLQDKEETTWKLPKERLLHILTAHLGVYPYTLVEYKPAYGHIFQDILEQDDYYTHWAYSDLDMVFGDLGRHVEEGEWNDYDIVTYGFGDQQRLYVKGQFTMHKISDVTKNLWKGCTYLSEMDKRFDKIMNRKGKFQLESAEGCYPSVLMQNQDISIKFGVKAWTDVSETDTAYSHGVYMFQNPKVPHKHVLAKLLTHDTNESRLIHLAQDWFMKDAVYKNRKAPLQVPVGAMEPLELPHHRNEEDAHCMYWVQPKYQKHLCLNEKVSEFENVFWVKGKLYKQAFRTEELPSLVDTAPFFHFQEWKRRFRANQLAPLADPNAAVSVLIPQGGIVLAHGTAAAAKQKARARGSGGSPPSSPLGIKCVDWTGIKNGNTSQLPSTTYCLSGEPDGNKLHVECSPVISWEKVRLVFTAPSWNLISSDTDVTLVQTARVVTTTPKGPLLSKSVLQTIGTNLMRWMGQPSVVLLYVSPKVADPVQHVKNILTAEFKELDFRMTLFGVVLVPLSSEEEDDEEKDDLPISQKALQNMAMDVVPTRWYILGLGRGDTIVSPDTVLLARQKASLYQSMPGNLFLIPQFAVGSEDEKNGKELWNLDRLIEAKENHRLEMAEDYDPCLMDDDEDDEEETDVLDDTVGLWLERTLELIGTKKESNKQVIPWEERLLDMEYRLMSNLVKKGEKESSFKSHRSPLMLIDNLSSNHHWPDQNHLFHVLVREVEEFGGDLCFNTLRLAQSLLFGFKLNVLDGAFAASTPESRKLVFLPPRHKDKQDEEDKDEKAQECRACFMLEGADKLIRTILDHESSRAVVARGLWAERQKQLPNRF